ncbi:xanthine dehydrogenase [Elysia marginata]|uniref:Xanthine dehydrogenase n=1 Tax=Elysia marginata TaxID=1093978 RepID=A0AAV4IY49_9GAST|nr:xanthine dehydrogenase [Elysia marginata]
MTDFIHFHINGKEHVVPHNLPATTSLNEYLREQAGLPGTKVMCREAGCGCCAVAVTHLPPDSETLKTYSVQSVSAKYLVINSHSSNTTGITLLFS